MCPIGPIVEHNCTVVIDVHKAFLLLCGSESISWRDNLISSHHLLSQWWILVGWMISRCIERRNKSGVLVDNNWIYGRYATEVEHINHNTTDTHVCECKCKCEYECACNLHWKIAFTHIPNSHFVCKSSWKQFGEISAIQRMLCKWAEFCLNIWFEPIDPNRFNLIRFKLWRDFGWARILMESQALTNAADKQRWEQSCYCCCYSWLILISASPSRVQFWAPFRLTGCENQETAPLANTQRSKAIKGAKFVVTLPIWTMLRRALGLKFS